MLQEANIIFSMYSAGLMCWLKNETEFKPEFTVARYSEFKCD